MQSIEDAKDLADLTRINKENKEEEEKYRESKSFYRQQEDTTDLLPF